MIFSILLINLSINNLYTTDRCYLNQEDFKKNNNLFLYIDIKKNIRDYIDFESRLSYKDNKVNIKRYKLSIIPFEGFSFGIKRDIKKIGYGNHVSSMLLSGYSKEFDSIDIYYKNYNLFISRTDGSKEAIEPYFVVLAGGHSFFDDRLKLLLVRATIFGGKNKSRLSLSDLYKLLIGKNSQDKYKTYEANNLFSISLAYDINDRLVIYNEVGAEDWYDEGVFYPRWTGSLHGISYNTTKSKLFIEHARNNREWYNHRLYGRYTKGGVLIGHHMDTDADDLSFGIKYKLNEDINIFCCHSIETQNISSAHSRKTLTETRLEADIYNLKTSLYFCDNFNALEFSWYNFLKL